MEKVNVASSPIIGETIRNKITGISIEKNQIQIMLHPKRIIFKLNEMDENGIPCVYIDDTLEAKWSQKNYE